MKNLVVIGIGGALGSLTRYLLSESISRYPSAILISNIIGVDASIEP